MCTGAGVWRWSKHPKTGTAARHFTKEGKDISLGSFRRKLREINKEILDGEVRSAKDLGAKVANKSFTRSDKDVEKSWEVQVTSSFRAISIPGQDVSSVDLNVVFDIIRRNAVTPPESTMQHST